MSLTLQETNEVLKIAARADKRTIAAGDIEFWQVALRGLNYPECAAAVVEHYTRTTDYAMPKHVRDIAEEFRRDQRRAIAPAVEDGNHCGRPNCACTHTSPCDHGWIDSDTGVIHCATCHPGRRQEPTETRRQWMSRLQEQDAAWQRKQHRAE